MSDWRVKEDIDPYGERREDLRHAKLCWIIFKAMGVKKSDDTEFKVSDFLLTFEPEKATPAQDAQRMQDMFMMFAVGHNSKYSTH